IVAVVVSDVNDNPPHIYGLPDSLSIEDSTPVGSELLKNVVLRDDDTGNNSVLTFQLIYPDNRDLLLYVENKQAIESKSLFKNLLGSYKFSFIVTDNGLPALSTTVNFTLKIIKTNQFAPVFNSTTDYIFNVSETNVIGSAIGKVSAWDADDSNEKITYTIKTSTNFEYAPFTVNASNGLLTNLVAMVATSDHTCYKFEITASDDGVPPTGQLSSSLNVWVNVLDLNDHQPVFTQSSYTVKIAEDVAFNTTLLVAQTSDLDFGINAEIKNFYFNIITPCNLTSSNDLFKLEPDLANKRVSLLNAAQLDRESIESYVIELKAVDSGVPALESTANVTIIVTDVNDCIPHFMDTTANITVPRRTPVNFVLFTFRAQDCDLNR
ncbi:hypothetical protein HELRODRAFT_72100, partial [Helobdella robusta]|uniref:Cadherin domain-containing protein n=1 Tax=Helobdella robusta TaxID=6412 RepID=T1G0V7_HELRO